METIHFPDQPCPSWITHPVLALGNFDGLHRGHLKIIERVKRGAAEHGGHADGDDLRSASAAHRPSRQGAAAADDHRPAAGGAAPRRPASAWPWCASPPSCRSGTPRRSSAACWWTGCGCRRSGSAPTSCSATTGWATSACCARSATPTGFAPRRSTRCAIATSSSAAPVSAGWWPRAAWTKRARCSAAVYAIDGMVVEGRRRGRELGFPTANLETENELIPPHGVYATIVTIDGVQHGGVTNIGTRPTFGEAGSDDRDAHPGRGRETCMGGRFASRSSSGCATSGASRTWTRCARRSTPIGSAPSGCSRGWRYEGGSEHTWLHALKPSP